MLKRFTPILLCCRTAKYLSDSHTFGNRQTDGIRCGPSHLLSVWGQLEITMSSHSNPKHSISKTSLFELFSENAGIGRQKTDVIRTVYLL